MILHSTAQYFSWYLIFYCPIKLKGGFYKQGREDAKVLRESCQCNTCWCEMQPCYRWNARNISFTLQNIIWLKDDDSIFIISVQILLIVCISVLYHIVPAYEWENPYSLRCCFIPFSCLINMDHNRSYYMTLLCCKWDILSSAIGITTVRNWIQHVNTWHRDEVIDQIVLTEKTCGALCFSYS